VIGQICVNWIRGSTRTNMEKEKLTGLVVCGGKSSRMGTDKSKIIYHGEQQRYYLYKMLQAFCAGVYISCNEEQATYMSPGYEFITDDEAYADIGPAASLLSAVKKFPGKNWLVIACDYPFIYTENVARFVNTLKDKTEVAAFYNPPKKVYEPLLGYYSAKAIEQMIHILKGENYSLQHYLKIVNANKHVADALEIKNINTPDEMRAVKEALKEENEQGK
jgi:molybdopterin-guanine dinucleotide biosynthesis protein A